MGFLRRRRAAKEGVEATATVLSTETTGYVYTNVHGDLETDESRRVITGLRLRVHPPGGQPYEVEVTGGAARKMGGYVRGDGTEIQVRIDAEDPNVVVVDEPRAGAVVEAELDLLERLDAGEDIELPPESRWPTSD